MSQQRETIEKTINHIKETEELFYQQKLKEALDQFNVVIGEIMTGMDTLFAYKAEHPDFEFDAAKITDSLKEAMGALEAKDFVLLADILQYDFVEYLENIITEME